MLNVSAATALSLSKQAARRCFRTNNNNIRVIAGRSIRQQQQLAVITRRGKSDSTATATATASSPPPPAPANAVKGEQAFASSPDEPLFITRRRYQKSDEFMKTTWLSDPSTYPIFFTLGTALLLTAARCVHGFFYNDDVKVDPGRRGSVVRNYEEKDLGIKSSVESVSVKPKTGRSFVAGLFEPESN